MSPYHAARPRSSTGVWGFAASCVVLALTARPVLAIDALHIDVREIIVGEARAKDVRARLTLDATGRPALVASAGQVAAGRDGPTLRDLRVSCAAPSLSEPRYACDDTRVAVGQSPIGKLALVLAAEYRTDNATLNVRGRDLRLAGGTLDFRYRSSPENWTAQAKAAEIRVGPLSTLLAPWVALPAGWTADATLAGSVEAGGKIGIDKLNASLGVAALQLSNEPGTIVAENVQLAIDASLTPGQNGQPFEVRVRGQSGQALAGPALLDFTQHPLEMNAAGTWHADGIDVKNFTYTQPALLAAHGVAKIALGETPGLTSARLVIDRLELPAAYTSFAQLTLAATDFGELTTSGTLSGAVLLESNAVRTLALRFDDVQLRDKDGSFFMQNVRGDLNWSDATVASPAESHLEWTAGGAYGFSGGAARVDFLARAFDVKLTKPTRLPVFDGAIAIRQFALGDLDTDEMSLLFEGDIEPISMALICKAFGWPEFSGQIAGRVPAVELRNKELRFGGDIEASIFDGRLVASNVRFVDPLGNWPRAYADIRARNLDLELVTRTFSFGTITGRLDADVLRLELFDWAPVAFDARLATPPGDRSRHKISAKAVTELANIGGGGGGVAQALQSGVLQFFDEYSYAKLGIRCTLSNDVCLMSGVEPAGIGYYIVKGRGVPRIDIIGNEGRVNWPQLLSQIEAGMASDEVVVQ